MRLIPGHYQLIDEWTSRDVSMLVSLCGIVTLPLRHTTHGLCLTNMVSMQPERGYVAICHVLHAQNHTRIITNPQLCHLQNARVRSTAHKRLNGDNVTVPLLAMRCSVYMKLEEELLMPHDSRNDGGPVIPFEYRGP